MEIKPRQPTAKGPADWFIGDVWIDSIVQTQGQSTLNVAAVHFGPRAHAVREMALAWRCPGSVHDPPVPDGGTGDVG
jgi:hypothetical protein